MQWTPEIEQSAIDMIQGATDKATCGYPPEFAINAEFNWEDEWASVLDDKCRVLLSRLLHTVEQLNTRALMERRVMEILGCDAPNAVEWVMSLKVAAAVKHGRDSVRVHACTRPCNPVV
jgi:hypothetical protein